MSTERSTGRSILRWLPGVLVSLVAVYFLLKFISLDDLLAAVKTLTALDIIVIILLNVLSFVARSMGWKNLLEGISFKQAFLIINEGYLFNNLIPRSGEVVRMLLVGGLSKISAFQAASSILVERSLDIIVAAALFLFTLPLAVEMSWIKPIAWTLFVLFVAMIVVLVILARHAERVKQWLANLKINSPLLKETIFPKIGSVLDGLATLNDPLKFARAIFWILMSWVCWIALLYFGITRISNGPIPLWQALFTQGLLALGIALPSAPASFGVYEGTMVAALAIFNYPESASLSIALVLHFTQIVVTSIFGIYGLMVQGQSITALLDRIRKRKDEASE
ncbi:MAG: glycosyltransferase 2 family protein [Chloroflexota bacterium]|nr:glycosyltransferase 2 family protein [Chloroflexota bacterium]